MIAVAFAASLAASCAQDPAAREARTPLTEVASRPDDYAGQSVRLEGVIRFVYAPGIFITGPEGRWPTDSQRLLVIAASPDLVRPEIAEGALVRITGTARVIQRETFARDFASNPATGLLGEDFFDEWNGRSAVMTQQIDVLPRQDKQPKIAPATQPATAPAA